MQQKREEVVVFLKLILKPPPERESTAYVWKYAKVYSIYKRTIYKYLKVHAGHINNFHSSITTTTKQCN